MKTKSILTLYKIENIKVNGKENKKVTDTKKLKINEQRVFSSRKEVAYSDGLPITRRFKTRQFLKNSDELQYYTYAKFKGVTYKVRTIEESVSDHYIIIELGTIGVIPNAL